MIPLALLISNSVGASPNALPAPLSAAPTSIGPETVAAWDKFHANIVQHRNASDWSTETGKPDESIRAAIVSAVKSRVIAVKKSANIPSPHNDESSADEEIDDESTPTTPLRSVDSGEDTNILGLDVDAVRCRFLEYIVEPILIQRSEDVIKPVSFIPNSSLDYLNIIF